MSLIPRPRSQGLRILASSSFLVTPSSTSVDLYIAGEPWATRLSTGLKRLDTSLLKTSMGPTGVPHPACRNLTNIYGCLKHYWVTRVEPLHWLPVRDTFSPFAPCSTSQMRGPPFPGPAPLSGDPNTSYILTRMYPQCASLTCVPLQTPRDPRSHLDRAKSTVSVSALITCSPRSPPTPPTTLGTTYPTSGDPIDSKQGL